MNRIKIILSYIIGFILSVCLFALAGLFIIKKTALDKSFMFRMMDENNYYEKVYTSICENIEDYMMSSGLEKDVLDGVITKSKVKEDIINYTNDFYEGKKYEVDTTKIKETLKNNINDYLKKLNLGMDSSNELDLFVSDTANIYKKEVSFYNTLDSLSGILVKASHIIDKVLIVVCLIVVVLSIVMLILGKINLGSCVMSGGIILFLIKLFIFERVDTQNILLVSDNFSLIIRSIFKYIDNYMISVSIILVIVGFIFSLFKNKRKNH